MLNHGTADSQNSPEPDVNSLCYIENDMTTARLLHTDLSFVCCLFCHGVIVWEFCFGYWTLTLSLSLSLLLAEIWTFILVTVL